MDRFERIVVVTIGILAIWLLMGQRDVRREYNERALRREQLQKEFLEGKQPDNWPKLHTANLRRVPGQKPGREKTR